MAGWSMSGLAVESSQSSLQLSLLIFSWTLVWEEGREGRRWRSCDCAVPPLFHCSCQMVVLCMSIVMKMP